MTATVEDLSLEHLDFPTPCTARRCQAGRPPATWILYLQLPCGARSLTSMLCNSCRDRARTDPSWNRVRTALCGTRRGILHTHTGSRAQFAVWEPIR